MVWNLYQVGLLGGALRVPCQGIMMTLEEILQSCSQETTGGVVILLLGNMESLFWVLSLADRKKKWKLAQMETLG